MLFYVSDFFFLDNTPVFAVFGIDNGRAKSVYEHLSSTFVVVDPIKKKKKKSRSRGGILLVCTSDLFTCTDQKLSTALVLTQRSGGG